MADFSVWLIILSVIVAVMVFVINVYVLVNYQHPDDKNQAYFPKFVVVAGLTVAQLSILMLPLDVANRKACENSLVNGACNLTLPMEDLWYAVYIIDAVFVFLIIPFTIFYYEGDQEKSATQRIFGALQWMVVIVIVIGLVLGIAYGLAGYADYPVTRLVSTTVPISTDFSKLSREAPCYDRGIPRPGAFACDAFQAGTVPGSISGSSWKVRVTFPVYVIALTTIVGSVLFSIFGGIGLMSLPLDAIFAFLRRPRKIISRAEYIKEATEMAKRAREIREVALALQREERSGSKSRKWRNNVKKVNKELVLLEEDENYLNDMYPQGEQAETTWAVTVIRYMLNLVFGIIGFIVSVLWIIHIIIFMLVRPPVDPFLNQVFIKLDRAFGLFGTAAFTAFCFYLFLCLMAGEIKFGMNFLVFTIHPMKTGATLMNSFLFNVALMMVCSAAIIQFCAKAFSLYAAETAVQKIFGNQLENLRGIKYLFKYDVFQIALICFALLTFLWYLATGWKKKQPRKRLTLADVQ